MLRCLSGPRAISIYDHGIFQNIIIVSKSEQTTDVQRSLRVMGVGQREPATRNANLQVQRQSID